MPQKWNGSNAFGLGLQSRISRRNQTSSTTRSVGVRIYPPISRFLLSLQVSTDFILSCLGPCAKYSACLYPTERETLEEAEILMLESYCEKARLGDGLNILDLGCGMIPATWFYSRDLQPASNRMGQRHFVCCSGKFYEFYTYKILNDNLVHRNIPTLASLPCPTLPRKRCILIPWQRNEASEI